MAEPDIHVLRSAFAYDPDTGHITWTIYRGPRVPGDMAGYRHEEGYRYIRFGPSSYSAHRLAWIMHHGTAIPNGMQIDHANGIRDDNRASNLRLAAGSENLWNRKASARSTSGFKGVCFHKPSGLWAARIRAKGKTYSLGYFKTAEQAHEAYKAAAIELHGEFAKW